MKKYLLFFVVFCVFSVYAEVNIHEKIFTRAKEYYIAKRYDSTITIIRGYLRKYGKEKETIYIVPLLMEALVRTEDFTYFDKLLNIYKRKFPNSSFMPRLLYLDGIVKAKKKKYKKALLSFSSSLKNGLSGDLYSLLILNVEKICDRWFTASELSRLLSRFDFHPKITEVIAYYEFRKLYSSGQATKAKKLAEKFRKRYPNSSYQPIARQVISKSKIIQKNRLQIGLLAPITGENADLGKYIVQGVKLAVEYYNKQHYPKIELIISDTYGNMVETAKKTHELVHVHKVPVIIGPVLSSCASVASSILMENPDIVMITPTATDDGIAQLGKNIFQMNVTLGTLGRRIASYAINNLNIREFAIIAPISEYGRILSNSFKEEVAKLGGQVLVEEHFDEGTNDFRIQFESLRKKLAERNWAKMPPEARKMYGDNAIGRKRRESYLADTTIEIGGIFIPAESEDAVKIASQVYFHRLRTQLLGSNGWHTNATILSGKRYVNNAIFSTSFLMDVQDEKWVRFSSQFKNRFNENPDRIAAPLGYDAANLVCRAIEANQGSIADKLRLIKDYRGVAGIVSFTNPYGINSEASIFKISDKKFIRVQ